MVLAVVPLVAVLRWKMIPVEGVITTAAYLEPAVRVSRIITPALAEGSLLYLSRNARNDCSIAVEWLINVVERVGRTSNVSARAAFDESACKK